MSWAPALLWLFGALILVCCAIVLWWPTPKRRRPVIRAKPCADSRIYSVGKRQ